MPWGVWSEGELAGVCECRGTCWERERAFVCGWWLWECSWARELGVERVFSLDGAWRQCWGLRAQWACEGGADDVRGVCVGVWQRSCLPCGRECRGEPSCVLERWSGCRELELWGIDGRWGRECIEEGEWRVVGVAERDVAWVWLWIGEVLCGCACGVYILRGD